MPRWAAVLAAGPGAALSHREAAALHALLPGAVTRVDVTTEAQRRVPGIAIHRARLDAQEVRQRRVAVGRASRQHHRTARDQRDLNERPHRAILLPCVCGKCEGSGRGTRILTDQKKLI